MSIAIHLIYTGTNGGARRFAEEMEASGTAERIRQEDGNESYEYYFPMRDPESVLLIDGWRDQQALDAHHASPMMQTIITLREKYDLHMKVQRYRPEEGSDPGASFIRR